MKFNHQELTDLTTQSGGAFNVKCITNAYNFCEQIAKNHYENFPVGSLLVPGSKRKYFYAIYAIARISDDIADELTNVSESERIQMLDDIDGLVSQSNLNIATSGNPILMALHDTFQSLNIPEKPVKDLLAAFKMDVNFKQPENWDDVENYCELSANPVGELILRIFDNYNTITSQYSDAICTGLQLTNFWQDLSRDLPNERYYIPINELKYFDLENKDLVNRNKVNNLVLCFESIFERTENYFIEGKKLIDHLKSKRLKAEIAFTVEGGTNILKKCKEKGINLLHERPSIKKIDLLRILLKVLFQYRLS